MKPEHRCLVPATSFCEYLSGQSTVPYWFALDRLRPMFAFAGLWRPHPAPWSVEAQPTEAGHHLYAFLITEPNALMEPMEARNMPVILTTLEECEWWLTAPLSLALQLQRPLPDHRLQVVAWGEKRDGGPSHVIDPAIVILG